MNISFRHTRSECQRATVRGFTLVELLVTVIVVGIVMAIGIPSFRTMTANSRLTTSTNELVAVLQEARMEAVRRRSRVVVCPSVDGTTCADGPWTRLITYRETGTDNQAGAAGETVLRQTDLANGDLSFAASGNLATARIWFSADGLGNVGTAAAATRNASVRVCSPKLSSSNSRDVSINISRVAVTRAHSANCAGAPAN